MIRVLHVDDVEEDFKLIELNLERLASDIRVDWAVSGGKALRGLEKADYDCILCDYKMPGMDGLELLDTLREKGNNVPFIFLTGQGNEALASKAFHSGANDYFTKEAGFADFERLANGIKRVVESFRRSEERVRTAGALRQREEQYRALLDAIPDLIFRMSKDGVFIDHHAGREARLLMPPEEFLGRGVAELLPPELAELTMRSIAATVRTGKTQTFEYDAQIGDEKREFESRMVACGEDEVMVIIRDITERKRAELELKKYEKIVNIASECIAIVDGNYVYQAVNHFFASVFGKEQSEMVGLTVADLMGQDLFGEQIKPRMDRCFEGEEVRFQVWLDLPGRGRRYLDSALYPYFEDGDAVSGVVMIARDITEIKEAEDELEELRDSLAERGNLLEAANKELESFTYSVSHDLRSPLIRIGDYAEMLMLKHSEALDEKGIDSLRRILKNAEEMMQLIYALLALSRTTRAPIGRSSIDLSSLALDMLRGLQEGQPDRKVKTVVAEGVACDADPTLAKVALENLLGNAWKFTSKEPEARIEFGETEVDGESCFYVRDNGVGFDPATADKLFVAFGRLHDEIEFKGTGIGLATVQRIVKRHGGRIWAEGEVGKGATFYFTIPPTSS